jgi:hypothetical protein
MTVKKFTISSGIRYGTTSDFLGLCVARINAEWTRSDRRKRSHKLVMGQPGIHEVIFGGIRMVD